MNYTPNVRPKRHDDRIIIHFDYDCFYASVFEAEDPSLKHLPLAVQQKQIIVTCNYEARKHVADTSVSTNIFADFEKGLHKLQLIATAKQVCPDLIIKLGEDLTRFRNASKALYGFLRGFAWSDKVEKLGFDEVFLDVTDIIDYNYEVLNTNNLESSFFQLSQTDPTIGFPFDARTFVGHVYPPRHEPVEFDSGSAEYPLFLRLLMASHLSQHIRHALDEQKGYTATVGISTSKLLSKLVGNCNKPRNQTTLIPPYQDDAESNVVRFISDLEIGLVPGIGFSASQKLRGHVLQRPAAFEDGLIYGGTKENITVQNVRESPNMSPFLLEKILRGPGAPHGIGSKVWGLLWGVDDTEVAPARDVPRQISIEDSYIRLDTLDQVLKELQMLAISLIKRMRMDLLEDDDSNDDDDEAQNRVTGGLKGSKTQKHWMAHPRTIRLTTRPRKALNPDGTRTRSFARISRSGPLPLFVFDLTTNVELLAQKLVSEALIPLFRKLHPEKNGWNLSLVNIGVTGIEEVISSTTRERDISKMFRRQDEFLRGWKIEDRDIPPDEAIDAQAFKARNEIKNKSHDSQAELSNLESTQQTNTTDPDTEWDEEDGEQEHCPICGAILPSFAMVAHERYHAMEE